MTTTYEFLQSSNYSTAANTTVGHQNTRPNETSAREVRQFTQVKTAFLRGLPVCAHRIQQKHLATHKYIMTTKEEDANILFWVGLQRLL
jgi:hypothetical protein